MANTKYPRVTQFINQFAAFNRCNEDLTNSTPDTVASLTVTNKFWDDVITAPGGVDLGSWLGGGKGVAVSQATLAAVHLDITQLPTGGADDLNILETALAALSPADISALIAGGALVAPCPANADEVLSDIMQTLWDAEEDAGDVAWALAHPDLYPNGIEDLYK